MTNSIGYPNQQQYPQNYSGVTIHVNNPALNTMANGYITNPYHQAHCCNPQCMGHAPAQQIQNYNHQTVTQAPIQAAPMQAPQNYPAPQHMANAYPPANPQPMQQQPAQQAYPPQYYLNNYNYIQDPRAGQFNPMQHSANNMQPPVQPNEAMMANPYGQSAPVANQNDMQLSQDIIKEIDARIAAQKDLEKNGKQKRVVNLTNEYIMSLENYLNNPNTEIRIMASKEILTRLNEDKKRYDDPALNALINKMLQDPDSLVRIAAMSALSSQLASGNEYTVKLLQDIQNNPNSSKEDVVEAANILLKMSADTEIKYVPVKEKATKPSNKEMEAQQKQIEQLQAQLQAQRHKEIEAQLAQQMQGK